MSSWESGFTKTVIDVIMPRMNGGEVGAAVRKNKPGARILFMSGYPADFVQQKSMLEEGAEAIRKPFSPIVLARKVREALDKKQQLLRDRKPQYSGDIPPELYQGRYRDPGFSL